VSEMAKKLALMILVMGLGSSLVAVDAEVMRKGPYLIYEGVNTQMKIIWQLNLAETCLVEWGTDTTYSSGSALSAEITSDHIHRYTIGGLDPGEIYYYNVEAAGTDYPGRFRAAPPDEATDVNFFVYGDTRTYPADHNLVARAINSEYTADQRLQTVVMAVGDLVTDGDIEVDWDDEFFDATYGDISGLLRNMPYQAAMGNHEGSGVLFVKYFPYPFVNGRYWSFDYGPAHFAVVDQYTPYGPGSTQLQWLEDDLAMTPKPWKFIILHEPGWSAGGHPNNSSVQNYIQPLCETYGVPIVFAGHNHYYARAVVNGIHHVTTGGGGAPLYTPNPSYPNVVYAIKAYNYCKLAIAGGVCHFTATTRTGTVIDTFTVTLEGAGYRPESSTRWFTLGSPEPNPFSETALIPFSLPKACNVNLDIYDVRGRKVRTLISGACEAGMHSIIWDGKGDDGSPVGGGIYFCRLVMGQRQTMRKIIRLK